MRGIRIVTTYRCNIMCSHCMYGCGPIRKGIMDVTELKGKVNTAIEEGYRNYIIIEGGEVLLNSGMLFRYLKSLRSYNMDKYFVTNGFWGELESYVDILRDLKLKGITGVIIEYDYLHSVFIGMDTVRMAIKKCLLNNIPVKIRAIFQSGSMESEEDLKTYEMVKKLKDEFKGLDVIFEESSGSEYVMPSRRRNHEKLILFGREAAGDD